MEVFGLQTLKSKVRTDMEIVNKPFTMGEYEKEKIRRILNRLNQIATDYPSTAYIELYDLVEKLLLKLYGNNHS